MKKSINKILLSSFLSLITLMAATFMITSCEEEETGAPPILERVSLVAKDSTTHSGSRGEYYVIFGQNLATTQEVYFSGIQAALNVTYVRNDNIIISIPGGAPFPSPNVLSTVRVITAYGEAQMEFEVAQPVPDIRTFSPAVASSGEEVTIQGEFFNGLESVNFVDAETGEAKGAEIISHTYNEEAGTEQIVVIVPDGVKVSYISITTVAGTGTSESTFGFNYAVFTDDVPAGWNKAGWSSTTIWNNEDPVKSGKYSAKHSYTGGWGGFQITYDNFPLDGYTSVKVSIYGGPGTEEKRAQIYITETQGGPATPVELDLHEGVWTDYTIPLSELGSPSQVNELVIQDMGTAPYLIFVDDLGFL